MARFYFHFERGDQLVTDDEGTDLPNFLAAQREAQLCARELLAEAIKSAKPHVPHCLIITDESGQEFDSLALADVLPKPFRK